MSQHCQSCATRKCPQTIYFREGSWISAKRCAIKHNESRGADPAPATALTSNSFCHPTFVSFMVSGGNIVVEMWIVDEKWEWCLSNGAAQRWREDRSDNFDHQVCLQYEFLNGGGSWFRWSCSSTQGKMSWIVICRMAGAPHRDLSPRPMIPSTWHRYCLGFQIMRKIFNISPFHLVAIRWRPHVTEFIVFPTNTHNQLYECCISCNYNAMYQLKYSKVPRMRKRNHKSL